MNTIRAGDIIIFDIAPGCGEYYMPGGRDRHAARAHHVPDGSELIVLTTPTKRLADNSVEIITFVGMMSDTGRIGVCEWQTRETIKK